MSRKVNGSAAATVAFEWMGSRVARRIIEPYTWEPGNDYTQAVDIEMAAKLLTYPIEGEFVPVAGQTISQETLEQLAELCGGTVAEVVELLGVNVITGEEAVGD